LTSFSEAIRVECAEFGVEVQTLNPGYVATGFIDSNSHLLPPFLIPTPEQYAKSAAATIGFMSNASGFWAHEMQVIFLALFLNSII
jgi:short-subunit dehydrogenase